MTPGATDFRDALLGRPDVPNTLEAVEDLVRLGDSEGVEAVVAQALSLLDDADPLVRRDAVELLRLAKRLVVPAHLAAALVHSWDGSDEAGVDALLLLAEIVGVDDGDALELVIEWSADQALRGSILSRLARSVPEVLTHDAARLLAPDDASVLLSLPTADHRAQVVSSLGPWREHHVTLVLEANQVRPLPRQELTELLDQLAR